jgi:lipid-A-disaccharide synthase-like uncharacterized protein
MRRRWLVLLELLALLAVLVWVGMALAAPTGKPPGAIDLKVQLAHADDRVFLFADEHGEPRYQIRRDDGTQQTLTPDEFARLVCRDQRSRGMLEVLLNVSSPVGFVWVTLGFLGQVLFTGRMLVQWLVSEKQRRSVVPPVFWWMSLCGASMLLVYFVWRRDPIGVLGQATGWFVYVRNLWLIHRRPAAAPAASTDATLPV